MQVLWLQYTGDYHWLHVIVFVVWIWCSWSVLCVKRLIASWQNFTSCLDRERSWFINGLSQWWLPVRRWVLFGGIGHWGWAADRWSSSGDLYSRLLSGHHEVSSSDLPHAPRLVALPRHSPGTAELRDQGLQPWQLWVRLNPFLF